MTTEIQVVATKSRGICVRCGNGLWGGPPCKHKLALRDSTSERQMMTTDEMKDILSRINYCNWDFLLFEEDSYMYLQVQFVARNNETDEFEVQKGRKWLLSEHMTPSELVQTAFKAVITALEHETRETFTYRGQPIFYPHYDIEKLVELSYSNDNFDTRKKLIVENI